MNELVVAPLQAEAFVDGTADETLRRMRAEQPCVQTAYPGTRPAWNIVRHSDIVAALRKPVLYSSAAGGTTLRDQAPEEIAYNRSILHIDPPDHTRLRSRFQARFRPDALLGLAPTLDTLARGLVDPLLAREEVDAVEDLAAPMVAHSICTALGVSDDLHGYFQRLSALMLADTTPDAAAIDYARLRLPPALLRSFSGSPSRAMMRLLRMESGQPNWLLPDSSASSAEGPTSAEIEDLLVILATAGTGMTQNCIVMGLRLLAQHWDQVAADRQRYLDAMTPLVEEVIRIACPLYHVRRTVTEDHEVHGQHLLRGDKVLLWLYSGNHDDAVFADPERFDPDRWPNPHLSFGRGGPHYCLGAALARMEVASVLRAIVETATTLEVLASPTMLRSNFVRETSRLRVRLR